MKKNTFKILSKSILKPLALAALFSAIVIGCASKSDTLPEDAKLADSDLFDGLKEDAASHNSSKEALTPAEEEAKNEEYGDVNIVHDTSKNSNTETSYDYYYVAVGGEKIGRIAYALYDSKKASKKIYEMNADLNGKKEVPAGTKIYFDMKRANPRSEFLTKDMVERYKLELLAKIQEKRKTADGNSELAEVVVEKGDTLQAISQRIYGTTRLWAEIYILNQDKINNFDALKVGTKLAYYPVSDFIPANKVAHSEVESPTSRAHENKPSNENPPAIEQHKEEKAESIGTAAHLDTDAGKNNPPSTSGAAEHSNDGGNHPAVATSVSPTSNSPQTTNNAHDGALSSAIKVTEKPMDPNLTAVRGGVPVDVNNENKVDAGLAGHSNTEARAFPGQMKRMRPPEAEAEGDSFWAKNMRRIIYLGFILVIVAGGYLLTRPQRGFKKSKFAGIQPMPISPNSSAPRPRVGGGGSSPGRVVVNRTGAPPGSNDQKIS